jgi:hypothetical protein
MSKEQASFWRKSASGFSSGVLPTQRPLGPVTLRRDIKRRVDPLTIAKLYSYSSGRVLTDQELGVLTRAMTVCEQKAERRRVMPGFRQQVSKRLTSY